MKHLLFLFVMLSLSVVHSYESRSPQAENDRDEQVAARAKGRMYPGGADEKDLKVQDPLPVPTRKVAPVAEEPREDETSGH